MKLIDVDLEEWALTEGIPAVGETSSLLAFSSKLFAILLQRHRC